MRKIVLLLGIALVCSCESDKETTHVEKQDPPTEKQDTIQKQSTDKEKEIVKIAEELIEDNKNSLDSIKSVIRRWNNAINLGQFEVLEGLYAGPVQFYQKHYYKDAVIAAKRKFNAEHSDYTQTYRIHQVEYPSDDKELIRVVLDKHIKHDDQIDTVLAVIEMRYSDGTYLITKESDQVSELRKIKSEASALLPKGLTSYDNYRWIDTRDRKHLAHHYVPNFTYINITYEDSVTVEMSSYSESSRHLYPYVVRNTEYDEALGILTFEAGIYLDLDFDENAEINEDYFESFEFKILPNHIALINTNGVFKYLEGTRLWGAKAE